MIIFKEIKNALRYLRKKGVDYPKGSVERINLKSIFRMAGEHDYVVCVITKRCKCGYVGDDGGIMTISKNSKDYKKFKEGMLLEIMCQKCMELSSYLLQNYNFTSKEGAKILEEVWSISRRK